MPCDTHIDSINIEERREEKEIKRQAYFFVLLLHQQGVDQAKADQSECVTAVSGAVVRG